MIDTEINAMLKSPTLTSHLLPAQKKLIIKIAASKPAIYYLLLTTYCLVIIYHNVLYCAPMPNDISTPLVVTGTSLPWLPAGSRA